MLKKILMTCLVVLSLQASAFAEKAPYTDKTPEEKLPIPRFVTLGTDEVNVRTGPGLRYPIRVIIRRDGLPVEIIREFDVWRQIRDIDGEEGWVHKSMLSGKRAVVVRGTVQPVLKKPEDGARPVVKLEPGVMATLDKCAERWCEIEVASYSGWIKRESLWGVYPDEKFEK
jgi:SH3-like domain-containing protein